MYLINLKNCTVLFQYFKQLKGFFAFNKLHIKYEIFLFEYLKKKSKTRFFRIFRIFQKKR